MSNRGLGGGVIAITFLAAFMLTILPLPEWALPWRPAWVALVLGYWCLALPQSIGVISGWLIGLLLDVVHGSLFGQHALGLAFVAYFIIINHRQIRVFPLFRQSVVMGSLIFAYTLYTLLIYDLLGSKPYGYQYLATAVTSAVLWPWIFIVLRDLRRKFDLG
ncbi:MAG: rod shape-determining protein MreD [Gammaproteobacteria bacterium]